MKENYLKNISLKNLDLSDNFKNFLINNLNFDQLIAVINFNGHFLVIAGAGSGKTRTIIYRALLLIELKIPSKNILILTFTRKAINEIKTRISSFLPDSNICIETFHSLAYRYLKKYSQNKCFKILTTDDALVLAKKTPLYDNILKNFSKDILIKIISLTSSSILKEYYFKKLDEKSKTLIINFLNNFELLKKTENFYSFDDLLIQFYKLLSLNLIIIDFQYIMVDEYQDTDNLQVHILKLLAKNSNLMVVGDDYQSIYGFKGTSMENILNFSNEFPNVKTIILKENYRSTNPILHLSNEFSKKLKYCFRKSLITKDSSLKKPNLNIFKNHFNEISFIFDKIKDILELNPTATIGILFRNFIYMEEFIKFFESSNIKFNVASNPFLENIFKHKFHNTNITLSFLTIHSSKGLEWDYVFIPLLLEGIIPSSIGDALNLEEEKRLFYVALTRAKKELFLSYPLSFYGDFGLFKTPSQFIENIDSSFFNIKRG